MNTLHSAQCSLPPIRSPTGSGELGADPRASLTLELLLGALDQPSPNFTHLLCGFNFDAGGLWGVYGWSGSVVEHESGVGLSSQCRCGLPHCRYPPQLPLASLLNLLCMPA